MVAVTAFFSWPRRRLIDYRNLWNSYRTTFANHTLIKHAEKKFFT